MWEELCGGSCVGEAVGELCFIHVTFLIHSQKCSICYSVACFSECVAEVVFVVQSRSNTECRYIHPPQEVQCVHMYNVAGT